MNTHLLGGIIAEEGGGGGGMTIDTERRKVCERLARKKHLNSGEMALRTGHRPCIYIMYILVRSERDTLYTLGDDTH